MGGPDSELWSDFQYLLLKGLMAARKHMDRVINIVEIMRSSKFSVTHMPIHPQLVGNFWNRSQVHNCRALRMDVPVR